MATRKHKRADIDDNSIRVKGMFRVHLEDGETGEIVGDSGWCDNLITNNGMQYYVIGPMGAVGASSLANYLALGTGGAPASGDTALANELTGTSATIHRVSVAATSAASSAGSRGVLQWLATFNSNISFLTASSTVGNMGLYGHSTTNSLAAGNTFTASSCATNNNVNVTYQISFS